MKLLETRGGELIVCGIVWGMGVVNLNRGNCSEVDSEKDCITGDWLLVEPRYTSKF